MKWFKTIWRKIRYLLIEVLKDKEQKESYSENKKSEEDITPISSQPGLRCPQCNFKMPVSMEMLLSGAPIECSSCGLKLNVEQEESKPALESLRKLDEALKKSKKMVNK